MRFGQPWSDERTIGDDPLELIFSGPVHDRYGEIIRGLRGDVRPEVDAGSRDTIPQGRLRPGRIERGQAVSKFAC